MASTRVRLAARDETATQTQRVIDSLRDLIVRRQLAAGQQLHQEFLAERLGVSRIPVREALKGLEAERLVVHEPNRGYFVMALNAEELRQTYLMRRLLETEVLRTVAWPDRQRLAEVRRIHSDIARAASEGAVNRVIALNRRFHFEIFGMSQLSEIVREIERLWHMSEQYRAFYLGVDLARARVVEDHADMIAAMRDRDRTQLIRVADRHRDAAEQRLSMLLAES